MDDGAIKDGLRLLAGQQGIDVLHFTSAEDFAPADIFAGRQPRDVLENPRGIVVGGIYLGNFYLPQWAEAGYPRTSRLVLSGFYFDVVGPLQPLADFLKEQGFQAAICDGFAEENSIPLKQAALRAGLGWQGKNSLIINEKYGSFLALGGIVTDVPLGEENKAMPNRCGSCRRCQAACPLNGLSTPGALDRQHCLSEIMEEADGDVELIARSQGYFLECDICQEVCPWNQQHLRNPLATPRGEAFIKVRRQLAERFTAEALQKMDEVSYQREILPYLSGVDLSYAMFRRNLGLS